MPTITAFHGTTVTRVIPGNTTPGCARATEELKALAVRHGIDDWTSVANVFERLSTSVRAAEFGITQEMALRARELHTQSRPTVTPPTEAIGFDTFEMPYGDKELGAHFGSKEQASHFGSVFKFELTLNNPLRLPDLGTWHYQSVIREIRKRGVTVSDAEYETIFNAADNNRALRELLIAKGYDSIVYSNEAEGRGDSYIAFMPEQIKTVRDNLNLAAEGKSERDAMQDEQVEIEQGRSDRPRS